MNFLTIRALVGLWTSGMMLLDGFMDFELVGWMHFELVLCVYDLWTLFCELLDHL